MQSPPTGIPPTGSNEQDTPYLFIAGCILGLILLLALSILANANFNSIKSGKGLYLYNEYDQNAFLGFIDVISILFGIACIMAAAYAASRAFR